MVSLQILNKVLQDKSLRIIRDNGLEEEQFIGYTEEFNFIKEHYDNYGTVPDTETFLDNFNEFTLIDVQESEDYLVDTLHEEYLYSQMVGTVQTVADLLKTDSNEALTYFANQLDTLKVNKHKIGKNIISNSDERYKTYLAKKNEVEAWFIPTGFEELDEIIGGWSKGEELAVIFARTGQGKSWVLAKTLANAWKLGRKVGYISPEMSADKVGYRFDTLEANFSNRSLIRGEDVTGYEDYIRDLQNKDSKFIVATPHDFKKQITISKLRQFIISNEIDIIGIDGITYMTDERYKRGDNKTTTLTNISEDLLALSNELRIPVLVVVQSNRGGVKDEDTEGTPDLENIRDSDGIAQNATKVIALRQAGGALEFGIKKHRDGETGGKLTYTWDIDTGVFEYVPVDNDVAKVRTKNSTLDKKDKELTGKDVF